MTGSQVVVYLLWFWFLGQVVSAQTCYFPNGQQAINDTACTANSVSICCQRGATCLGNGLCFDPFGSAVGGYIRGSCTDRSWQSSDCPQYCTYDNKTAGLYNTISDAGVLSCGKGEFCCESDPIERCNCQTRNGTFSLIGNLAPFTTIASSSSTIMTTATPSSSTFISSTTSSLTSTSSTTSSSTTTSSTLTATPPSSSNNNASKIGLGVGLGLGIPIVVGGLFGLLACLLIRHRRSRRDPSTVQLVPQPNEHKPPQPTTASYGYPPVCEAPA